MHTLLLILLVVAILGHITIWAALWNRLHGFGLSFGVCSRLTALLVAVGAVIPSLLVILVASGDLPLLVLSHGDLHRTQLGLAGALCVNSYMTFCLAALPFAIGWRIWRRLRPLPPVAERFERSLLFDLRESFRPRTPFAAKARAGAIHIFGLVKNKARRGLRTIHSTGSLRDTDWPTSLSQTVVESAENSSRTQPRAVFPSPNSGRQAPARERQLQDGSLRPSGRRSLSPWLQLPGNESLICEKVEISLALGTLPPALTGMKIVLLTDLHFVGKIPEDFYCHVVEHANREVADIIAITGDIVDRADCLGQAQRILSPLNAKLGVFFVLGNHDLRPGAARVRDALLEIGFSHVGDKVVEFTVGDAKVQIGGNELPWLGPPPSFPAQPAGSTQPVFRLLLAHTPDQLPWARRQGVQLMLAGHTHGGQACLPGLGPIIAPSAYGIRYAQGLFQYPPTTMYVSRGVGGEFPVRYFCPPELTCLILNAAKSP